MQGFERISRRYERHDVETPSVQHQDGQRHIRPRKLGRLNRYLESDVEEYLQCAREDKLQAKPPSLRSSEPRAVTHSGSAAVRSHTRGLMVPLAQDELSAALTRALQRRGRGGAVRAV